MRSHTGFVRSLNCFLDKLEAQGYIVTEERKANKYALSHETVTGINHNGLVWPLYYHLIFSKEGSAGSYECDVVVVTCEAGGIYGYDFNGFRLRWKTVKESIMKGLQANL